MGTGRRLVILPKIEGNDIDSGDATLGDRGMDTEGFARSRNGVTVAGIGPNIDHRTAVLGPRGRVTGRWLGDLDPAGAKDRSTRLWV